VTERAASVDLKRILQHKCGEMDFMGLRVEVGLGGDLSRYACLKTEFIIKNQAYVIIAL